MKHYHVHWHGLDQLAEVLSIVKETQKNMPSTDDIKAAVDTAAAKVSADITTAVQAETAQIVAQIKAIQPGTTVTQEFLDGLVADVSAVGTKATADVGGISDNDTLPAV